MIGEAGLTAAVLTEIDIALKSHELIKIRVLGDDRHQRQSLNAEICSALHAGQVQQIGKILVVFRPRPKDTASVRKPTAKRRKPPRRTKRSHQM